ncbi:hypothetical protein [Isoptericola haloaureus]|uniref:Transcriptional regulator, AbiEi antitoxin, Type IV TA system n=1 Tax=Isoptericola haloaureus TaxID=1542902 RepID=A0ABU7Z6N4_9MICO
MTTPAPPGRPGSDRPRRRDLPTVYRATRERETETRRRRRRGDLVRVRPGIYALPDLSATDSPAVRREHAHLVRLAAALAGLRTPVWASHTSAALLWGCWTYRLGTTAHVTQLGPPDVRRGSVGLRRHWTALSPRDRTTLDGVPVTTLERTAVDCARALPGEQAVVVVDSAMRLGADPDVVGTLMAESAGTRGIRSARRVLAVADGRVESPGESRLRWILADEGLAAPEAAVPVATWMGTRWVDLGWPELKVGFEFDGRGKYAASGTVRADQAVYDEKRRHDALREAGWVVLRVSWADLEDREVLLERVRRVLARSGHPAPRYRPVADVPVDRRAGRR